MSQRRWELARELLSSAKAESAFYRRKWEGFEPSSLRLPDDFRQVPFTTRDEISGCDPFDLVWTSRQDVQAYYESSGTTGAYTPGFPDLSFDKAVSFGRFLDGWMRLTSHRIRRAVVALAFELNPTGIRFQMALPTLGITVLPVGTRSTICPPERQVGLIRRLRPQAIFGRPLEILRLADAMLELGQNPAESDVCKVFYTGEIVSLAKRERLSAAWGGAEVYGHYGLTEIDSGLQTCEQGRYHEPVSPFLLTELVAEGGSDAVKPGQPGEIVLTSLRREAIPLFRYRTQDLAIRHVSACPCGLQTPSYLVLGRRSDALQVEGKTVFPIDLEQVALSDARIGNEYQLVVDQTGGLRMFLERRWGGQQDLAELAGDLRQAVRDRLGIHADVQVGAFGCLADKLGIAKQKAGAFLRLEGGAGDPGSSLPLNCVDRAALRNVRGAPLSI